MTDIVRIIYYILFNGLIGTFSHYVTNNVIEIDSRMSHVDDLISFHKSLLIVFMLINDDIMITYQNHCVMAELRLYSQIIGNFRNFEKLFYTSISIFNRNPLSVQANFCHILGYIVVWAAF